MPLVFEVFLATNHFMRFLENKNGLQKQGFEELQREQNRFAWILPWFYGLSSLLLLPLLSQEALMFQDSSSHLQDGVILQGL